MESFQVVSSQLLPVFSVIASITALQSIVIFVVVILVVCMYYLKRKDTPRAANTTSAEVAEGVYEVVKMEEKCKQRQPIEVWNNESYAMP